MCLPQAKPATGRTECDNHASATREDGPGPNILLGQGVLYGGSKQANAAHEKAAIDALLDGVLGMVDVAVPRRHDAVCLGCGPGKASIGKGRGKVLAGLRLRQDVE